MSQRDWQDPSLRDRYPSSLAEIPGAARVDPAANPARYLLGGVVVEATDATPVRSRIAVHAGPDLDPVLLGRTPTIDVAVAREALERAVEAWDDPGGWRRAPWEVRIGAVRAFAEELRALVEPLSVLLMYEVGKTRADARKEVLRSAEYVDDTLEALRALLDEKGVAYRGLNGGKTHHARDVVRPSGVAVCVGPFNYPINEFLTTVVPAVLMGNPVVAKAPRLGVLANQLLLDAFARCFPPGVVSVLPGDGKVVLPALLSAAGQDVFGRVVPRVRTLAFIGSEGAARAIVGHHPDHNFLTRILGLGAKNPAVILPGAALPDDRLAALVKGALGNNGQRCTAEKLLFVPRGPEGDGVVERIARQVEAMRLGMPWEEEVSVPPLPEEGKLAAMHALLDDALDRGARVVNDRGGTGFFSLLRPAVVDGVAEGMRLNFEEQFGPILAVRRYDDPLEALDWERRSPYGQQAAIWGPPGPVRDELVDGFVDEVARLNLNDVCQRGPDSFGFTATEKSGFGTLSLRDALLAFSRATIVQSPDPTQLGLEGSG